MREGFSGNMLSFLKKKETKEPKKTPEDFEPIENTDKSFSGLHSDNTKKTYKQGTPDQRKDFSYSGLPLDTEKKTVTYGTGEKATGIKSGLDVENSEEPKEQGVQKYTDNLGADIVIDETPIFDANPNQATAGKNASEARKPSGEMEFDLEDSGEKLELDDNKKAA